MIKRGRESDREREREIKRGSIKLTGQDRGRNMRAESTYHKKHVTRTVDVTHHLPNIPKET